MGLPAKFKLEPTLRGDEWRGIAQIRPVTINGEPPAIAISSARVQFRRSARASDAEHEINTTTGIQILDADAWILTIPRQSLPLESGIWFYDFETVNAAGRVKTYLSGTIEIKQDVTR